MALEKQHEEKLIGAIMNALGTRLATLALLGGFASVIWGQGPTGTRTLSSPLLEAVCQAIKPKEMPL